MIDHGAVMIGFPHGIAAQDRCVRCGELVFALFVAQRPTIAGGGYTPIPWYEFE